MSQTVVATIFFFNNLQTFDPNIISSLIHKQIERESYKVGEISLL